ncbi:MAG: MBL fold metallo-hydrolase [Nitrososphaerota archaeon]|nr:MBL fold metallo-hydrolase [Candidatus Calditenuis fumarioli]
MDLDVRTVTVGPLMTNCYVLVSAGEALVVDPGWEVEKILAELSGLRVVGIVATHAHFDHVGAVEELKERLGVEFLMHRADVPLLDYVEEFASRFGLRVRRPKPDRFVEDGDELRVGDVKLRVLHTPGHSPGSICLHHDLVLLSGDTLFNGSVGRTDFVGGSFEQLELSIKTKIYTLDDATIVYPGHGPITTVGTEKAFNPFVRP